MQNRGESGNEKKFPGITIGVTGAIGSGKSMVCSLFAELGRLVIDADPLARELMESDSLVVRQLRSLLGPEIYTTDGRLDRKLVATRIFGDQLLRDKVNTIVHPAVSAAIGRRLESTPAHSRSPYVIIEAALIYESGMDRLLNAVVVVDAPLELRLARVCTRDGTSRKEVLSREHAQMNPAEKLWRADFAVRNSGNADELFPRVQFFDTLFRSIFAIA